MAQTAPLAPRPPSRADADLDVVQQLLDELPQLAEAWPSLHEATSVAHSLDWDQAMALLRRLHRAARARRLSPAQRARYNALPPRLAAATPTLHRLGLQLPPAP
jgi:hypothetical protein